MTTLASPAAPPSQPLPLPPESTDSVSPRQRFTFDDASWDFYQETLIAVSGSHVRVTFDRGRMELMSPSHWHEVGKGVAGRLVELYSSELEIPIAIAGSTTLSREDLQQGLEPDESYYVTTPPPATQMTSLDLAKVPPPDLAIEIDVTNSSIPREPIYAAMGVPEVWRMKGTEITVLLRNAEGRYAVAPSSRAFPALDMAVFNRFLKMALTENQFASVMAFRDWIRSTKKQ